MNDPHKTQRLEGKKIAILVTDGFEQIELTSPKDALERSGVRVHLVAPKAGEVKGWDETDWGRSFPVDRELKPGLEGDYDALVLPGGVMNPDKLRTNAPALEFVRSFFAAGKPVAAICHAPWTLIDAGVVAGRTLTSYPSLKTDLQNAGAEWRDAEVVVDRGLVTSRNPDDLPAFNAKLIEEILEGVHAGQKA